MKLVYIENKELLTKLVSYFDYEKLDYTVDINDSYDTIIVAQNNKKTLQLMQKAKRVVFIAYLEELKIFNSLFKKNKNSSIYVNKMNAFFSKCNLVIVSLPYFKSIIKSKKVVVIPYENLCIGLCKNKIFNLKKKAITIIDSDYRYIDLILSLVNKNSNLNFELIGYKCILTKHEKFLLNDIPSNLKLYKYCNERIIQNYINDSQLIIFFDNILKSNNYLNICLNLKKNILLLKDVLCNDYFIDNKNIYLFNLDSMDKKFNKIIKNRVCNLGIDGYQLIRNNNFDNISDKFCKLFK